MNREQPNMFDPVHLKSFVTVADCGSFTEAGRRLRFRQSTVSQHVSRLERQVGRRLFVRDTHSVVLTTEGEAMVGYARSILSIGDRAREYFLTSRIRGRVRFGASEDLVLTWLPIILSDFVASHPHIDLELNVALSQTLIDKLDAGELDLVFCKRYPGEERGQVLWRDRVVWVSGSGIPPEPQQPVSLILYPPPSMTRTMALAALQDGQRAWRIACTSTTLLGLMAAAEAGLGIMAHSSQLIPPGLCELAPIDALPQLGAVDFVLLGSGPGMGAPARELSRAIRDHASKKPKSEVQSRRV